VISKKGAIVKTSMNPTAVNTKHDMSKEFTRNSSKNPFKVDDSPRTTFQKARENSMRELNESVVKSLN